MMLAMLAQPDGVIKLPVIKLPEFVLRRWNGRRKCENQEF